MRSIQGSRKRYFPGFANDALANERHGNDHQPTTETGVACTADTALVRPSARFVDTPLSASLLNDHLDARRDQLRATLPIRRVVGPADVAALAVHIMNNEALTGATYDIDGGQQLVASN